MIGTLGLNLEDSCWNTSANNGWCFNSFRIFIILTIAAYKQILNMHTRYKIEQLPELVIFYLPLHSCA